MTWACCLAIAALKAFTRAVEALICPRRALADSPATSALCCSAATCVFAAPLKGPGALASVVVAIEIDGGSLKFLERNGRLQRERSGAWAPGLSFTPPYPEMTYPPTAIWSDATYSFTGERRGEVARAMVEDVEARGMLSAGYLEARAAQLAEYTSEREPIVEVRPYVKWTQAQCSTTVRDSRGAGSGWAGLSSYDWAKIDAHALAALALEKCKASQNPLALEPGRYTVILEPQAVADLLEILVPSHVRRRSSSARGRSSWASTMR